MKFTLSWLKDYLDTEATLTEISETLTALGLEVEEIVDPGAALKDFVVGEVLEAKPHPDADRLQVLTVNTGKENVQIVCGAPNARKGLKGVLAQPGVTIPVDGTVLKKGKIRGIESFGMMCSVRELALGEDHEGIIDLESDAPAGTPVTEVLDIDPVIEIAITPNRADCLGVRGIARDLAAAGLGEFKSTPVEPVAGSFDSPISVSIDLPAGCEAACSHFVGRYVRGVKNGPSPQWLQDRLTAIGLRPISALVDITNYISYSRARPLHVFDADKLVGNITPRFAKAGETILALDEIDYTLDDQMLVIADDAGPQAIGGVMGGLNSGCTEDTVNVFIEAAMFDAGNIAQTGRKLQIDSDARYRYERGVDPTTSEDASQLATGMILEFCGGEASHPVIAGQPLDTTRQIELRAERVQTLGGMDVPVGEMQKILAALGFDILKSSEAGLTVCPPSWRGDVTGEHDLIEEILRVVGYDNVPTVPMPRDPMPSVAVTTVQRRRGWMRRALASRGITEAVTYSFMDSRHAADFGWSDPMLKVDNPISSELDVMRPSILPNLIAAAGRNAARGLSDVALFEIGPQFDGPNPGEQQVVAAGIRAGKTGPRNWGADVRAVDVFDAKADVLAALEAVGAPATNARIMRNAPDYYHPGQSGTLSLGKAVIANFGTLHPAVVKKLGLKGKVVGFEIFLEALPQPKAKPTKARPLLKVSSYQAVERDFAFVVDDGVQAADIMRAISSADKALVQAVSVFDVFVGDSLGAGKKSVALSMTLQAMDRTLKDDEIEAVVSKAVAAVEKATGGVLRG